jgi:hypothetical protein
MNSDPLLVVKITTPKSTSRNLKSMMRDPQEKPKGQIIMGRMKKRAF